MGTLKLYFLCCLVLGSSAKIVDLSYSFKENETVYLFNFKRFSLSNRMGGYLDYPGGVRVWSQNEEYSAHSHGGTHMDAPVHMGTSQEAVKGRWALGGIPPERLMGPIRVINVVSEAAQTPNYGVTVADITRHEKEYGTIPEGAIVLMNSGWGLRYPDRVKFLGPNNAQGQMEFPGWSPEAAQYLTKNRDIYGIGSDGPSLDVGSTQNLGAHTTFLGSKVFGLEMVANVHLIPEAGALGIALPMKTDGASGGPCRFLAVWGDERFINHATGLKGSWSMVLTTFTVLSTIMSKHSMRF